MRFSNKKYKLLISAALAALMIYQTPVLAAANQTQSLSSLNSFLPDRLRNPEALFASHRVDNSGLEELQERLQSMMIDYEGTWSVYVKNLNTSSSLLINPASMRSASVMKLFIMGAAFQEIEKGKQSFEELAPLIDPMITLSDNATANELVTRLGHGDFAAGVAIVNGFLYSSDYLDGTRQYNGFSDPLTLLSDNANQTTVWDCAKILEDIYYGLCISKEASEQMKTYLFQQETNYKIPSVLPESVKVANKTGEMDSVENDVALVYTNRCNYILCILSDEWSDADAAVYQIQEISSLVYEYLVNGTGY